MERSIVLLFIGAVCGFLLADYFNKGEVVQATHRDAVTHADGTVEVERSPFANPELPAPKHPKGTKPVGTVEVTISGGEPARLDRGQNVAHSGNSAPKEGTTLPKSEPIAADNAVNRTSIAAHVKKTQKNEHDECLTAADFTCPDVSVRMDLVTEKDGQMIVLLKPAQGHEVIEALHIPAPLVAMHRNKRITLVGGVEGEKVVTYTQDKGRWSYGVGAWEIAGESGIGLAGSFAF
jgi:hypothetical protein